jgi:hypothetical protein
LPVSNIEHSRNRYETRFGPGGYAPERIVNEYPEESVLDEFISAFGMSNTESIDLFLSRHPRFETIGKLAISMSILSQENRSGFGEKARKPEHDWYFYLYNKLTRELIDKDGCEEFGANKIAFVTFNYDRSLEQFLFESLLHSFEAADESKVIAQLCKVPIIHVYGKIAPLPGLTEGRTDAVPYDRQEDPPSYLTVDLLSTINNLYVVHEERANPQLMQARQLIAEAERIFFLGFAYADENLKALGLPGVLKPTQLIYGTAMGFTDKEITDMRLLLAQGLKYPQKPTEDTRSKVHLKPCDSVALLREFL